jgi:hypothetical protein
MAKADLQKFVPRPLIPWGVAEAHLPPNLDPDRRHAVFRTADQLQLPVILSRLEKVRLFVKGVLFTQSPIRACGFIGPFAGHSGARGSSFYEQLMPYRGIFRDKVRFVDDDVQRWPRGRISGSSNHGRIIVDIGVMGRIVPFFVFPHQIERA